VPKQAISSDAPVSLRMPASRRVAEHATDGMVPPRHRVPSFLALRFQQLCLGVMAEVLDSEGLNTKAYGALTTLDAEPGIDQQGLAARLGIDKVSAGQLVDRLERDGLVRRNLHPTNRRVRLLQLTTEGLALRRRLQPAALAAQERILAPLRPEEREPFIDFLTRVIEGHGAYVRPGNGRRRPLRRLPDT
jgi:MarR family transcriptional regulator, temperature-dependent positive regulator of motility